MVMTGVRSPESADVEVVLGVDTHLDFHVVVALDTLGRHLGELTVPTTTKGYKRLLCWAEDFGSSVRCAGVEGTSSYGAGLARYLTAAGVVVAEVERPKRRHLRRNGKSDPPSTPRLPPGRGKGRRDGGRAQERGRSRGDDIRALRTARRSAVKARGQAANQLQALVVTAPEALRERLRWLSTRRLVAAACCFRPGAQPETPEAATKQARASFGSPPSRGSLGGDSRAGHPARSAGGRGRPGIARPASCRHRPRGDAFGRGRGQSREAEERGFLRQPLRSVARRSLLRQGGAPPP